MLKYAKECIQLIKYKEYILKDNPSNKEKIKRLLSEEGLHLLVASAGGGKTFGMIEVIREIVKDDQNTVYVIACPNRIQNLQNHKSYKIFALVGGTQIDYGTLIVSAVYNKADEIVSKLKEFGKDVVVIIDEAHQLISADGYRKEALESLDILQEYAKTVIHMTATHRKLYRHYKYDTETQFKCTIDDTNLNNFHISKVSNQMNAAILSQIKNAIRLKKTAFVLINDKNKIKYYEEYYKKFGFTVGVLTGNEKDKESALFKYIVKNESIPSGYDVILTTTVVEVGTNIKKPLELDINNLVPIYAVCNANYFDIDSVIQFFARFRRDSVNNIIVDDAFLLVPDINFKTTIKSINTLEEDILPSLEADLKYTEKLALDLFERYSLESVTEILGNILSVEQADGGKLGQGIIQLDIDGLPFINQKALTNRLYRDFDRQLLSNLQSLEHILKDNVKYKNIIFSESEEAESELKELNNIKKELDDDTKEKAKEIITKLFSFAPLELDLLIQNQSLDKVKFSEEFINDIKFLREEKTQLRLLRKSYKFKIDLDLSVKIITKHKVDADIQECLRKVAYAKFNNSINLNYYSTLKKLPRDEYGILRLHLDPLVGTSKRLSNDAYIYILNDFYKINKFKKVFEHCKKLSELQEKKKKSTLSLTDKKDFDKYKTSLDNFKSITSNELRKIYIFNEDKSRLKKLKTELTESELFQISIEEFEKSLEQNSKQPQL